MLFTRLNFKFLSISLFSIFLSNSVFSQNEVTSFQLGSIDGEIGESVCLPITVNNFVDILGLQMTFGYDSEIIQFDSLTNFNAALRIDSEFLDENFGLPGVGNVPFGRLTFIWVGPGANPVTLEENSLLFEICFTIKKKERAILGFYNSPTPIQVIDEESNPNIFNGVSGFINKNETATNNNSFFISVDTSFQSFDFTDNPNLNESVTLNHFFEILSLKSDAFNLRIEEIEVSIPSSWDDTCLIDFEYNDPINCGENGSIILNNTGPELFNFRYTLNPQIRESGSAIFNILLYDPADSINTRKTVTLINEFIVPEIEGPEFSLDFVEVSDYFFVNSSDQFPVNFNYQIDIENQTPSETIDVVWEKISQTIPPSWAISCDTGFECPPEGETFNIEPGNTATWELNLFVSNADQKTDTAFIEYLVYAPLDSINTQQIITKQLILEFPELTEPVLSLSPNDISQSREQNNVNESFSFNETLNWNYSSIFPRLMTWEVVKSNVPSEWNYNFTLRLGSRFFEDGLNPIPSTGTFLLDRNTNSNGDLFFEVTNLNGIPGKFELEILFYDAMDRPNTTQTLTVEYTICPPPVEASIIIDPDENAFCEGETITISAQDGFASYAWNDGSTGQFPEITVQNNVSVQALDTFGCRYSDEIALNVSSPFNDSICIVTVDAITGKNAIVWTQTMNQNTAGYKIYKESSENNQFEVIAEVDFDAPNIFVDQNSNPLASNSKYLITTLDSCGNELSSEQSLIHKTIFLTSNLGMNGEVILNWDPYEGFEYATFNILRGTSPDDLSTITELSNNTLTFTDPTPPAGEVYYQIEIEAPLNCIISGSEPILQTKSNTVQPRSTTSSVNQFISSLIQVSPNPAIDEINIQFPTNIQFNEGAIFMVDQLGRTINQWSGNLSDKVVLETSSLDAGIYTLMIQHEKEIFVKKVVVSK